MSLKVFLLNLCIMTGLVGCQEAEIEKVVIYTSDGKTTFTEQNELRAIGDLILGLSNNINDVLRVLVTPVQVDNIVRNEYGVEIQYSGIQEVNGVNQSVQIPFNKIYIPLSGRYTTYGVVFFFADEEGYGGVPPYVTEDGLDELKSIVQSMKQ